MQFPVISVTENEFKGKGTGKNHWDMKCNVFLSYIFKLMLPDTYCNTLMEYPYTMNQKMHYFLLIYFYNKPLHVSSRLAAHHQEDQLCVNSTWYSHVLCWLAVGSSSQTTQHITIPIAIYTELILLMMSSKPVRNM